MMWSLPTTVTINEKKYPIRNKCDFRVVLDVISSLNDEELEMEQRVECALFQFYGNDELDTLEKVLLSLNDIQIAMVEMMLNGQFVNSSMEKIDHSCIAQRIKLHFLREV